jgi:nucleotide-binding universal stress UspA family protein
VRARNAAMYPRILVANDGSAGAAKALAAGIALAKTLHSELHMVSVEELPRLPETIGEVTEEKRAAGRRFEKVIHHAQAQAKLKGIRLRAHVIAGHAVPSILDFIERDGFDLLVIGYMGHSAIYNRLIGSTTDRLVEWAPCPVLVVK